MSAPKLSVEQSVDLAVYGACLLCGAPRTILTIESEGVTMMGMVCSAVSAHGPDRIEEVEAE